MAALSPAIQFADAEIFHARLGPNGLRFRYSMLAVVVDLDRLNEATPIPFFSLGRFNLFGFYSSDHGPRDGSCLRAHVDKLHAEAGLARPDSIVLICFPRILGYVFNPISIYCCRDSRGRTTGVVYEVRNTFGQHHTYLMPVHERADGAVTPHECDKLFYVSPFMDMPLRYRFLLAPPRNGFFNLKIIERGHDGVVLTAMMRAKGFSPTRSELARRIVAMPLAGFKGLAAIHWQALRLWWRGHAVRPRPELPPPVSVDQSGRFSVNDSSLSKSTNA